MKKTLTKSVLMTLALAAALPALSACNTFAGVGEDLQRGGAAIEREAEQRQ